MVAHPGPKLQGDYVTGRRCAVIANPLHLDDPEQFRTSLFERLSRAGFDDPLWLPTSEQDTGRGMAIDAVARNVDLVLIAGGDGTVRVVCGELAGSDIPVGVLPAGTGNLLARNLDVPLAVDAALDGILDHGVDRTIDIGRIGGDGIADHEHFAVMAGLGADAAIIADAPDELKRRLGWAVYLLSAAKNLGHPAIRVRIQLDDDKPIRRRVLSVVLANVGSLQGGIELLPDAEPDDGLLDVLVITPERWRDWPGLLVKLLTRQRPTGPQLEHFTCRRVQVQAVRPARRQLDGDLIEPGRQLRATIRPGSLRLRLPKSGP